MFLQAPSEIYLGRGLLTRFFCLFFFLYFHILFSAFKALTLTFSKQYHDRKDDRQKQKNCNAKHLQSGKLRRDDKAKKSYAENSNLHPRIGLKESSAE